MSRGQQGFSMIEAMVSVLVLSGGLLGLAFLQAQGMKFNVDAYQRTQATVFAYDIIDRLRANPTAARAGAYVVPTNAEADAAGKVTPRACDVGDGSVTCTPAELAVFDLAKWYQAQLRTLALDPNNYATINRVAISPDLDSHTVTMRWFEQTNRGQIDQSNLKTQTWEVRIRVP